MATRTYSTVLYKISLVPRPCVGAEARMSFSSTGWEKFDIRASPPVVTARSPDVDLSLALSGNGECTRVIIWAIPRLSYAQLTFKSFPRSQLLILII